MPDRWRAIGTPAAAARRRPTAPWLHRKPCDRSAGRGADRRHPSPADHRVPGNRRAPARWRMPPPQPNLRTAPRRGRWRHPLAARRPAPFPVRPRPRPPVTTAVLAQRPNSTSASTLTPRPFDYEVLTSAELAQRLKVKESWVVDQSKPCRTHDPIPVFRLGKHRRYRWGSPELNSWLDRRAGYNTQQRKAGSSQNGGTM